MAKDRLSGELAVILHADVAGSTHLVQQDEHLAHERIQDAFRLFSEAIRKYHGRVQELRGDALLAGFERTSDAVSAALSFQSDHYDHLVKFNDDIQPKIRIGIALGEVVIADNTVTGAGVVLAQRVEQLAEPGGLCITSAIHEALPKRLPFEQENLGEHTLKGFDELVQVYAVSLIPGGVIPEPESLAQHDMAAAELPDKPSIAVLPFTNMSGDKEQEYFADGMTEDLITDLSNIPGLFVIARNSSFSYKDQHVKVRQVAEDLGVRYVLEGSVQRAGDQVRINAQLIDAITGGHLWARRYDRNWEDIFSLQDDITQHIVANIISFEGPLEEALRKRIEQKRPSDLRAYDYLLLGRNRFFLVAKEDNIIARGLFQKSLEIEPSYSKGHTWMAWTHLVDFTFGWTDDPVKSSQSSLGHAQKAVVLDNSDPEAHWVLGAISIQSGQQPQKGLAAYQKAISLSPNNADLLAEYGWAIPKVGKSDEAIISIKKAMRLNPIYPDWYSQALIFALYTAKRYEEVIKASEEFNIRHLHTYLELAGSFAKLGRKDEARKAAANALKLNPDFSLSWWRERINFSNTDALEHYMDGLRKTGLPD